MNEINDNKIDFVILWVDGNDPKWREEKSKFEKKNDTENGEDRYRDWENLQYWFRGVEKYAPWVNNIFFVTYGHLPDWLNTEHPKLKIIKHTDFIPDKYLPTFNSNAIELNLNKLKELGEQFVLFNDDVFIIDKVKKEDFFKNGLPCESFVEDVIISTAKSHSFAHVILNNMQLLNEHFNKRKVTKKNFFKFFNIKYGVNLIRNICLVPWGNYSAIKDFHIPTSMLKSTLDELWRVENDSLDNTCNTKFRDETNINQYLIRYWQLVTGNFNPRKCNIGKMYPVSDDNRKIIKDMKSKKHKLICINDGKMVNDFEKSKKEIIDAFEEILPTKSSFEK